MEFQSLRLRVHETNRETTEVRFEGARVTLDEMSTRDFSEQILALVERHGKPRLILNFANVVFVSSLALGTLVNLRNRLAGKWRCLTIEGLQPQILDVFAVSKLDKLLDLRPADPDSCASADCLPPNYENGVLVVDDEPAMLSTTESMLRHGGFHVWSAVHGYQAVEQYWNIRTAVAVVLLDVLMPGLNGPQTLRALQKLDPMVCCCFMSGTPEPHTEVGLLQMGALRVFQKPFTMIEFASMLKQLANKVC
jgi:anti-sigma B factor antagonist